MQPLIPTFITGIIMVRQKTEFFNYTKINNVITFQLKDDKNLIKAKDILELKQCGITKNCITSTKENLFNCSGFEKCKDNKKFLELFI